MLPDDVFRVRLEETLIELESWAAAMRECADIEITASEQYWHMTVNPWLKRACPFELLIDSKQTFALALNAEAYDNAPIDQFDLFPKLARAIASGRVEKIETRNALTGILIAIAMRVEIAEGWDWIGHRIVLERSLDTLGQEEVCETSRYLPYQR
jgi:hypothetical protein